ncbi:type III-B CRISPR module-associated Cmr3 family protein [Fretibacterium fastidiosum]|uniref:type III-B CRISPR module-associated Cmr3 family protein n=1 Tax=Fretibacterium fastidiosum TaxID=651822 RepID=UPI001AD83293|nr:type III-B CRISPR module-associated Cmr3 family protein [Fretibacterium fastidiosum]
MGESTRYLRLTPLSPLIVRDSRPFGAGQGNRVRSMDWISPSVIAGAVRTAVWKAKDTLTPDQLKTIEVCGGFPVLNERIYLPRPLDALIRKTDEATGTTDVLRVRPMDGNAGVRMPHASLVPSAPVGMPEEDFKPESGDAFWPLETMAEWLGCEDDQPASMKLDGLPAPVKEDRTNVTILPESGAAEDARLFTTTGLDFVTKIKEGASKGQLGQMRIGVRVNFGDQAPLPERLLVPLGGERRLAEVRMAEADEGFWEAPKNLSWTGKKGLRMVLATPAIFEKGWLPGWLREEDGKLTGEVPGSGVLVRLVSAVVGRWKPLSGWSYEKGRNGPKALRRMVPAGSVYFFEVLKGGEGIADLWLHSVCDCQQDGRDGFGLALWGCWRGRETA